MPLAIDEAPPTDLQGQLRQSAASTWNGGWPPALTITLPATFTAICLPAHPGSMQSVAAGSRRAEFAELAAKWKRDTRFTSSLTKIVLDSSYQSIMAMGKEATPWILGELQESGGHWLWALRHITNEDPAQGIEDFATAGQAWLTWGRVRGHI